MINQHIKGPTNTRVQAVLPTSTRVQAVQALLPILCAPVSRVQPLLTALDLKRLSHSCCSKAAKHSDGLIWRLLGDTLTHTSHTPWPWHPAGSYSLPGFIAHFWVSTAYFSSFHFTLILLCWINTSTLYLNTATNNVICGVLSSSWSCVCVGFMCE